MARSAFPAAAAAEEEEEEEEAMGAQRELSSSPLFPFSFVSEI